MRAEDEQPESERSSTREVRDKLVDAASAVKLIRDGDVLAVGGTLYSRTPMALVFELIRSERRRLTLCRPLTCFEAELLIVSGVVDRLITSWVGIGLPWGLCPTVRRYVETGRASYEEWSHLAIGLRLKAAAMGLSFLPTHTMLGSDLERTRQVRRVECPFTGRTQLAVPALHPDVALIHAHRGDRFGNVQVAGYRHMDSDMARAASTVIVSVEELVSTEQIIASPTETMLPHFTVDAVVHQPWGSYPHECYALYDADTVHFDEYAAAQRSSDPEEAVRHYVETNVTALPDHGSFLDEVGEARLEELARDAETLTR